MNNQPSFGMASKVLKSVDKLGSAVAKDCNKVLKRDWFGACYDMTLYKEAKTKTLCCKATPCNFFNVNNALTRFIYGLCGKSHVEKLHINAGYKGVKNIKGMEQSAVKALSAKMCRNKKGINNIF